MSARSSDPRRQLHQRFFSASGSHFSRRHRNARTITPRATSDLIRPPIGSFTKWSGPRNPWCRTRRYTNSNPPALTGDVLCVYFLSQVTDLRGIQEIVNAVRSTANILHFFPVSRFPSGSWTRFFPVNQSSAIHALGDATAFRLFHTANVGGPDELQETVNRIRRQTQVQRVYPVRSLSLIAFRGTEEHVLAAEQICSTASQH